MQRPNSSALAQACNIDDLRELARRRLPRGLFEFVDRGTEDEVALRLNREAFERIKLVPRVAVDVRQRSTGITLFGQPQPLPIVIAPTGIAGLLWYDGEVALAKAAAAAGIPFTLATSAVASIEEVAERAGGRLWYQVYLWPERRLSYSMIERARDAGCEALVLTVDTAVAANREYNIRNGFSSPFRITRANVADVLTHPRWMLGTLARYLLDGGMPKYRNYPPEVRQSVTSGREAPRSLINNESVCWDDVNQLRKLWPRKLIVKGILSAQDAREAVSRGADGVVVSNHGGRSLDCTPSSIEQLGEVVEAVRGQATVLIDSGFRRGSDVVKALALGADAVLVGRGTLYGTGAGGYDGACRAIEIYRSEIQRVLALIGCLSPAELGPQLVRIGASRA